jgi:hypothetical protein
MSNVSSKTREESVAMFSLCQKMPGNSKSPAPSTASVLLTREGGKKYSDYFQKRDTRSLTPPEGWRTVHLQLSTRSHSHRFW